MAETSNDENNKKIVAELRDISDDHPVTLDDRRLEYLDSRRNVILTAALVMAACFRKLDTFYADIVSISLVDAYPDILVQPPEDVVKKLLAKWRL